MADAGTVVIDTCTCCFMMYILRKKSDVPTVFCAVVKKAESKQSSSDSGKRQGCTMCHEGLVVCPVQGKRTQVAQGGGQQRKATA
jgi:hypothetical protein